MATFNYTGAVQNYVVPAGVSIVKISAAGAQGHAAQTSGPMQYPSSKGAHISSYHAVTPGETLRVYVGGQGNSSAGWNGGGQGGNGGGGGASDVRRGGTALSNRIIAAGGGGGLGGPSNPAGGNGGYPSGGNSAKHTTYGRGGTQTAGGYLGGALGVGGAGQLVGTTRGGGGGGGWYGGGGGHAQVSPAIITSGGGGGSSRTLGTLISAQSPAQANRTGNGQVIIDPYVTPTPTLSTPAANATIQSRTINVSGSVAAAHPLSAGKVRLGFQLLHATDEVQIQYVESADTTGAGSAKFTSIPNGTYRVRARTVGTHGLPNSAWTALRTITVDHRPTVQGVHPTSAPESNGVTLGQSFRLKGIDPDPSDTIKRYRVQVRAGTTVVADTGSVTLASPAANGATFDVPISIAAEHLGKVLNWRAYVRDENDSADGVWSSWSNFVFAEAPSVLINSPEDSGTATSGAPTLSATYNLPAVEGQARRAAAVRFTVRDVSTGNIAYQYTFENRPASAPGLPVTEALEIAPPQPVLENDREYILTVRATDQFGIFSEADSMFLVQYESPDPIDYSVDVSQSSSAGFVRVDWSDSAAPITRINLLLHPFPGSTSWSGAGAGATFSLVTSGGPLPESPSVYRSSVGTTGNQEKYIYTSLAGLSSTPVTPGRQYNFSAYVMMKGPGATTPTVRLRALWYDETGVQIPPSDGSPLPAAEANQWIRRSENFTAPAAARFVRFAVIMSGTQSAGVVFDVSAAQITEGPALHPYFNGNSPELPGQAVYSWEGAENSSRSIAEISRIDGEFQAFRVYRRYLPSGDWKLIFETDDNLVTQYDDWLFEPGVMVQYNVTQIGTRFGVPVESPLGYRMTLTGAEVETRSYTPLSDRYWIICPEDPSLTIALSASEAAETEEYESESYGLIGRGRHRDYGTRWGYTGSLTVKIRQHDNRSETKLAVERLRMEQRTYYLRTPFGRVHPVAIGDLSWTPLAGVGNAEMGDLVIPYEEVAL